MVYYFACYTKLSLVLYLDLHSFRQALSTLQAELDELDRLKVVHYQQVLDHEQEVWDVVAGKVCLVVRSSLEIFDKITSKSYVLITFSPLVIILSL